MRIKTSQGLVYSFVTRYLYISVQTLIFVVESIEIPNASVTSSPKISSNSGGQHGDGSCANSLSA